MPLMSCEGSTNRQEVSIAACDINWMSGTDEEDYSTSIKGSALNIHQKLANLCNRQKGSISPLLLDLRSFTWCGHAKLSHADTPNIRRDDLHRSRVNIRQCTDLGFDMICNSSVVESEAKQIEEPDTEIV